MSDVIQLQSQVSVFYGMEGNSHNNNGFDSRKFGYARFGSI